MATRQNRALSARRHKYVEKALELLTATLNTKTNKGNREYTQNRFPEVNEGGVVCSTSFCFAGFLVLAKSPRLFDKLCEESKDVDMTWNIWAGAAGDIIGIDARIPEPIRDNNSTSEANSLFGMVWEWPDKFYLMYHDAETDRQRVAAARARWRQWLKESDKVLGIK
jgi:hypothetical protein